MCKLFVVFFCVMVAAIHGQSWVDDLSTLGDRITAQVNKDMQKLQHNLHGLQNRISDQVYTSLEPVRALEQNEKMKNGIGGVTIAKENPGGRTFIVRNHQKYSCTGTINLSGQCDGSVTPFKLSPNSKSDWCFVPNYSQVNDQLCLGTNGINLNVFNGEIHCSAVDGQTLLIDLNEYQKLCQDVYTSTEYRYIPDVNDPQHVPIPNDNKYVKCDNNQANLCVFTQDNQVLRSGSQIYVANSGHVSL